MLYPYDINMLRQRYSAREIALRDYLRAARKRKGLSQVELAKICKLPQSFVSKYEIGERYLSFTEVLDLCDILDIELQDLLQVLADARENEAP